MKLNGSGGVVNKSIPACCCSSFEADTKLVGRRYEVGRMLVAICCQWSERLIIRRECCIFAASFSGIRENSEDR